MDDYQKNYELGCQAMNNGSYEEAIKYFSLALEINPNSSEAYEKRGEAYFELSEWDKWGEDLKNQIKVYSAILKENPDDYRSYCKRGVAYGSFGEPHNNRNAIYDFTKSIEICNTYSHAYFHRGIIYLSEKKYHLAFKDFEFVLYQHPEHTKALYYLGYIFKKVNKIELAIEYFQKSITSNPKDSYQACRELASHYKSLEDYEKAIQYLKMLLAYDHDNVPTLADIGKSYAELSQFNKAIQYYTSAIEKDDANRSYLFEKRAAAYYHIKEYSQALTDIDKALLINEYASYLQLKAKILIRLGALDEEIAVFDKVYEKLQAENVKLYKPEKRKRN